MATPGSWSELYDRWQSLFAVSALEVEEWMREAAFAVYGVESLRDLNRTQRSIFFQKASGVLLLLEDEPGELAFARQQRRLVQDAFAKYTGALLNGPPWSMSPDETDRPTQAEWTAALIEAADFDQQEVL